MKTRAITTALLAFGCAGTLQAAFVVQNVSADATSWWDQHLGAGAVQWVGNLTNNSGMSNPYDITATHAPNNNAAGMWHAKEWSVDPNPVVTFGLGGTYDLVGIYIWNGNQPVNLAHIRRGVHSFELYLSTDGGNSFSQWGAIHNLPVSPLPSQQIAATPFDLTGQDGVTHVQIRVLSTHNSPGGGGDYASLSEVMFVAIPEPSVALLGGLGVLGLLRRRR